MVVITLDVSVGHNIKYVVEGGDKLVKTAIDLDTSVRGLGGAVRVHLARDSGNTVAIHDREANPPTRQPLCL